MSTKMNLKQRLTWQFVCIGLIPLIILGFIANWIGQSSLEAQMRESLNGIKETKRASIERYFRTVEAQVQTLANDPRLIKAATELHQAFRNVKSDAKLSESDVSNMRRELANYYGSSFANEYKAKSGQIAKHIGSYISTISDEGVYLQSEYIAKNPNPVGSKHVLDRASDRTEYSRLHAEYHPYLRDFVTRFEYYDTFLVDLSSGELFYTDFKEIDFGTNLIRGHNARSAIGKVFQDIQRGESASSMAIADFAPYYPSYEAPAAFVGTRVLVNNKPTYALIFQLSIDKINEIMGQRVGLGKTGESYLVGSDYLMRSNSFFDAKNRTVVSSFMDPENGKVETESVRAALEGKSGVSFLNTYSGKDTLSAYSPIDIYGLRWALIAEITQEEAYAPQRHLAFVIFSLLGVTAIIVAFVGAAIGRSIATPILRIATDLGQNSDEVARAANDLLRASEQLSELAEEQAESINETAASTDEIAAMVENNVGQAASSAEMSKTIKTTADKVDASMEKLQLAMNDIRDSNEQIQELVTVIGEIAEKSAVIDEIVFQTKLLSFNASVEAERAGEHGRGFAVVAQEVGNLAKMSGKASIEITSMVKDSVKKAERITRVNSEKVSMVGQLVAETETLLDKIGVDAEQLQQQAQQILSSSKEQSDGIKQINEAMIQLEQATRLNSSSANSTAAASDELRGQATHLAQNVLALLDVVSEAASANTPTTGVSTPPSAPAPRHEPANVHPIRGYRRAPTEGVKTPSQSFKAAVGSSVAAPQSSHGDHGTSQADAEWEKL